jgi:hypothetical protein
MVGMQGATEVGAAVRRVVRALEGQYEIIKAEAIAVQAEHIEEQGRNGRWQEEQGGIHSSRSWTELMLLR